MTCKVPFSAAAPEETPTPAHRPSLLHAWQLPPAFLGLLPFPPLLIPGFKATNPYEHWLSALGRQGGIRLGRDKPVLSALLLSVYCKVLCLHVYVLCLRKVLCYPPTAVIGVCHLLTHSELHYEHIDKQISIGDMA